jgi:hypothetical protein
MDHRYFFMRPLLNLLGQPVFFCRLVATALRAAAALIVLLSLTIFFKAGKLTFELPAERAVGGVLFEVFFIVAVYAVVHTLLLRARDVEEAKPSESYALATLSLLMRLLGEMYCAFVGLVAIGGGLFVWFTNRSLQSVLGPFLQALFPGFGADSSFVGGIQFMAIGVFVGVAVLVASYAASQLLMFVNRPVRNGNGSHAHVSSADVPQTYRSRFGS